MNMNEVVNGVVLSKACSVKPFKNAPESKTVTLRVKYDGVTLQNVFDKALATTVIQWQNGPGRKHYASLKPHSIIEVTFKAPGRSSVDPEAAMKAHLDSLPTPEARRAYIAEKFGITLDTPVIEPDDEDDLDDLENDDQEIA